MNGKKIERRSNLSYEQFLKEYLIPGKPVILTGVMEDWPAMSKWGAEYFKSTLSNQKVKVAVSENGMFPSKPEQGWSATDYEQMDFFDYLNMIEDSKKLEKVYYLQHKSLPDVFPELLNDIQIPKYIKSPNPTINLWIGSGGNVTPIHYDFSSNFLAQVKGEKKVILFEPSQSRNLYALSVKSKNSNLSPINTINPDFNKHSKYRNIPYYECTIEPGQMLFIPLFWWHWVNTINRETAISINYWWNGAIRPWFSRQGIKTLCLISLQGK